MKTFDGQPVIVLGMGRSGTSILAKLLQSLGVDICRQPVPENAINPRGFVEEEAIVRFHQSLKKRFYAGSEDDSDYDAALVDEIHDLQVNQELVSEAAALLDTLQSSGIWGWKDPRTVLFIDLWLALLPNAAILVPFRHPLDILDSFLRRVPERRLVHHPDQVFRSYATYHRKIIEVIQRGTQSSMVFYAPAAYRSGDHLRSRIQRFLGVSGNAPDMRDVIFAGEFADPGIRAEEHRLFSILFPEAAECFDRLNRMAEVTFEPQAVESRAVEALIALADSKELSLSADEWVPLLIRARGLDRPGYFQYVRNSLGQLESTVQEQKRYIGELEAAKSWFLDQLRSHQEALEKQAAHIRELETRPLKRPMFPFR